ncbi:hypothetical protein FTUN_3686 [Frigoriglobus tundricola]|uniref:PsbP C-terminal domain-containing protein n=2 Tax=Frigoriglobus tundricola TaxID=2774151 RepID=A0A6M5YS88_9BACT|nr:hypothetical protein FTUN_3686 [Frigoriglobus tundricola]
MRTMVVIAALVACAAGLSAQDAKKYEKDGKFTAKFPSTPEVKSASAGGLKLNVVVSDSAGGKGGFMVTYSDIPADKLKAPTPEQVLESSEKGLAENFKAKITKSSAAPLGPKKYPAREVTAEREEFHLRGTIVLAGGRLYQVYAFGSKEFASSKEASDFLASFAVTE